MTESEWVKQRIGRTVVEAFNMIVAEHILHGGNAAGAPGRIAIAIACDDPHPKHIVMQLIDEIGLDSVDAGTIAESWRQQPGSLVYCNDLDLDGVRCALSDASSERPAAFHATSKSPGTYAIRHDGRK